MIIGHGKRKFHYKERKSDAINLMFAVDQMVLLDCRYLGSAYKTWPHVAQVKTTIQNVFLWNVHLKFFIDTGNSERRRPSGVVSRQQNWSMDDI